MESTEKSRLASEPPPSSDAKLPSKKEEQTDDEKKSSGKVNPSVPDEFPFGIDLATINWVGEPGDKLRARKRRERKEKS